MKMKSIKNMIKVPFYILITILLISLANADFSFSGSANLGGTSQDRGVVATTAVTLTNDNLTSAITGVTAVFTTTKSGFSNTDFNITATGTTSPITIPANGSTTLTITGYVPLRLDSGQSQIGNLVISGVSGATTFQKTVPVTMAAVSKLKVTKVELDVNGDTNSISNGKTVKVKRGDSLGLTTKVENMFQTSGDIEISDITVYVTSDNLDIDEEDTIGTLSERDDDSVTLNFDIPDDADDRKETVTIKVDGTDDNDAIHTATFDFDLDVQVERYDLKINDVSTTPASVCPGQTISAKVEIENSGVRDLDKAQVYFSAEDLNFAKKISDIVIDFGDTKTITQSIQVPTTTAPGTYILDVKTYYDTSSASLKDEEAGSIVVKNCQGTTTTPPVNQSTGSTGFQIQQPPVDITAVPGTVFATPATKKSTSLFGSSDSYLLVLVFTNVLILVLLVVILMVGRRYY